MILQYVNICEIANKIVQSIKKKNSHKIWQIY